MTNSFFNFTEAADFASQLQDSYDDINRGYERREQLERENDRVLAKTRAMEVSKFKQFKEQAFAKVAFQPVPDVAPPQPVMQNVGAAMFMDALSIGSKVAGFF